MGTRTPTTRQRIGPSSTLHRESDSPRIALAGRPRGSPATGRGTAHAGPLPELDPPRGETDVGPPPGFRLARNTFEAVPSPIPRERLKRTTDPCPRQTTPAIAGPVQGVKGSAFPKPAPT